LPLDFLFSFHLFLFSFSANSLTFSLPLFLSLLKAAVSFPEKDPACYNGFFLKGQEGVGFAPLGFSRLRMEGREKTCWCSDMTFSADRRGRGQ
jgi:hypothetical protein